jgi:glycosyltransferase involved in cell wall biosynthesis
MDKNVTVSIIMPTYNSAKFVKKAIESILLQTFQDFELLIVDDCSTDHTLGIVQTMRHEKIRLFHTPHNLGAAGARNLGMAEARGRYIGFLDADDYAYPQRLEEQVGFLEQNPDIDLLGTWTEVANENDEIMSYFKLNFSSEEIPMRLLFQNCFALSSVMMRNKFTAVVFDGQYAPAEDYEYWTRLAKKARFAIIPSILTRYLEHSQGISKVKQDRMRQNVRQIITKQLNDLGIIPNEKEYELHQQIAHFEFCTSKDFLSASHQWLHKLLKTNELENKYPHFIFSKILANYWIKICLVHATLGFYTLQYFLKSPFRKYTSWSFQIKVFLLCLKFW